MKNRLSLREIWESTERTVWRFKSKRGRLSALDTLWPGQTDGQKLPLLELLTESRKIICNLPDLPQQRQEISSSGRRRKGQQSIVPRCRTRGWGSWPGRPWRMRWRNSWWACWGFLWRPSSICLALQMEAILKWHWHQGDIKLHISMIGHIFHWHK